MVFGKGGISMQKEIIDYSKDYETYCELNKRIRKACICNIRTYLDNLNTTELEVTGEAYEEYQMDHCSLYISYDGGNHPEYASNMFSEVETIKVDESNEIVIETEDGVMREPFILLVELQKIEEYLAWYSNEWLPEQSPKQENE